MAMARACGATGRVISLEPHPDIVDRLKKNLVLNHVQNVDVLEAALSDRDGKITFYGFAGNSWLKTFSFIRRRPCLVRGCCTPPGSIYLPFD